MSWTPDPAGPTPDADSFAGSAGAESPGDALGGNDTLDGQGGDDYLEGGDDNDSLIGGEGDDTLLGGSGDDTIRVGPGQDSMVGGGGTDVLDFSDATAGVAMVLAQDQIYETGFGNQESVHASGFTVAYGSQHNDELFAGSQGNDSLFGNDGDDGVHGNDGDDTIDGGIGNDLVTGENGIDVVSGGDGNDTLHGGQYLFEDPIFGAADADAATLDGGADFDVAILNRGNADHDLSFTAGSSVDFDSIAVLNAEAFAVRTGSGNDTLVGGDSNDSLDGGTGTDSLVGGDGYDLLVIDHGDATDNLTFIAGDAVSFDGTEASGFEHFKVLAGTGNDVLLGGNGADAFGGGDGNDWLEGGDGDDTLVGGAGSDTAIGGVGNDIIHGQEDDDSLDGGEGDDTLHGGLGTDTFMGGAGNDSIDGGDAITFNDDNVPNGVERVSDYVTYENAAEAISLDLGDGSGQVHVGELELDDLVNIEQIAGTGLGDTMGMFWGDETVAIRMDGLGGDDLINLGGDAAATLDGGDGNDTIFGGRDNDTILGGAGDDSISAGAGDDSIVATPGADTVEGGAGNDSILTGEDNDVVIWNYGDGDDTIDLGAGHDTLILAGWNSADTASDAWQLSVVGTTATFTGNDDVGGATITVLNYEATDTVACFAEGTRIMTARGEIPVEALRVGDLALTAGAAAAFKPIRWLGHARIDLTRHRARDRAAPVLITAGALGEGVPHCDLRVSPEHALLIDGALVPAGLLLNGSTILQETWRPSVTYWHVELEAHGVLVAEGALAESYLNDGNRHFFGDTAVVALDPDFGAGRATGGYAQRACAPVVAEGDAALARIRLRLAATARRCVA